MTMRRRSIGKGLLGAAAGGLALPAIATREATAQRAANTLRIGFRDAVPNVDPYYNSQRTGLIIGHQAFDGLVHRDPETFRIVPALATEWRWLDGKTLEFTLRQGVKFHDGSLFGPDDVVYTINTVADPASRVATPSNYAWLQGAEKTGPHSVRLHLKHPMPAALEYLALVTPIWPKAYRERVGPEGFARAPVGTGPYRFTKVDVSTGVEYERFDDYYQGGPKGRPAIQRITARYLSDAATEMTELLSGRVDWIWNINPDQMESVNRMPNLQAVQQESMRVGYLQPDAAGRSGPGNPMTKQKVRQALYYAIDRRALAERLVRGGSRVPDAPCFPSQFGCEAEAAVRYEYDPAKARALLAEAGYPNGFDVELTSYVQPRQWSEAVQNYLQAVGIRARLNLLQVAAHIQRAMRGELTLNMGSWGSYSINDVSAILPNFFGGGGNDYARDPEVTRLVEEGGASNDEEARRRAYAAAIRRITEQAYWIPLHTYVNAYAFSKQLDFRPWPDELPRFYLARWK
ncbi:ABC transporter substrate-binding protein [Caldovatus aquaticus]|uniref:ABC transporter substrate-binding protein n=1 Tax=Caldovatus aquaticus TaxID=2865671 RepID=A0ABS7EX28_9PROT|nr:ABC transporter substrate-binding protein [Caldovatus aquaticus]MBW8267916.1 ABC transporter substrate-binding protein [Caldovatus aquaticus]